MGTLIPSHIWSLHINNFIVILSRVYNERIQLPAPSWLVSSTGRALHWYRRGQGFKPRTSLKFFRLSFRNCKSCVYYNCDEILWCINYIDMCRWRQSEYRYCFFFPSQDRLFAKRHDVQAYNSHAKDEASFSTVQKRLFSSEPSFLPSTIRSSRFLWNLSSSQTHKEKPETTFVCHNIVVEFT